MYIYIYVYKCEYQILVNFLCLGVSVLQWHIQILRAPRAPRAPWHRVVRRVHQPCGTQIGWPHGNRSCYLSQLHRSSLPNGRTLIKKNKVYSLHLSTLGPPMKGFCRKLKAPTSMNSTSKATEHRGCHTQGDPRGFGKVLRQQCSAEAEIAND